MKKKNLKNSKCDKSQTRSLTKLKMWRKKTQELRMWQNSTIQNVTKKLKISKSDKTQKLNMQQNFQIQTLTKLQKSKCGQIKN